MGFLNMSIDNRLFVVPLSPFFLWLFVRIFWAITVGEEWSYEVKVKVSFSCLVMGLVLGAAICSFLFDDKVNLGRTTIWPKDEEEKK